MAAPVLLSCLVLAGKNKRASTGAGPLKNIAILYLTTIFTQISLVYGRLKLV